MPNKIERIIILGHNGFIGSHMTKLLHMQSPEIEIIGKSLPEFDLTDKKQVVGLSDLFDVRTSIIMFSCIKKQWGDNLEIFAKNMKMVVNLCQALKEKPIRRMVYFSSAEVYGHENDSVAIDEETAVNPTSYYGIAKYASECLIRQAVRAHNMSSLLILRPPLVYGPGDTSRGYGPSGFVWAAANQQPIKLWGEGEEFREFIFIGDLVKIVFSLLFVEYDGVVNIASGKSNTFQEVLDIVSQVSKSKLDINIHQRTNRKVDNKYDNQRLSELLPDFSFTDLYEGIRQTFEAELKDKTNIGATQ